MPVGWPVPLPDGSLAGPLVAAGGLDVVPADCDGCVAGSADLGDPLDVPGTVDAVPVDCDGCALGTVGVPAGSRVALDGGEALEVGVFGGVFGGVLAVPCWAAG